MNILNRGLEPRLIPLKESNLLTCLGRLSPDLIQNIQFSSALTRWVFRRISQHSLREFPLWCSICQSPLRLPFRHARIWCGRRDSNPYACANDSKSLLSASSSTSAYWSLPNLYTAFQPPPGCGSTLYFASFIKRFPLSHISHRAGGSLSVKSMLTHQ